MSDAIPLPSNPHLDHYRKQAKDLLKACRSNATRAWATRWVQGLSVREADRIAQQAKETKIARLADAQFFLARAHGFESWPKFAKHIEALRNAESADAKFEAAADAIVAGDVDTLRRLLREDRSLIHRRSSRTHRSTLLHYVSANGIEDFRQKTPQNIAEIAKVLLDAGADVNAESDAYGGHSTTLGLVATSVHPEDTGVQDALMELLLERGATIDRRAIHACLANGRVRAAEFLARRGAHLDLEGAAGVGRIDVVESSLHDATVRQIDTAFLRACAFGRTEIVKLLLARGVDPAVAGDDRMTGLHWAAHEGHLDIIELLLARGAPLEAVNGYGGTVLGGAVWSAIHHPQPAHLRIIETLVDAGARVGDHWFTGRREIDQALRRAPATRQPPDDRVNELKKRAQIARHDGDLDEARELYERAVVLCRELDDPLLLAHTLRHLGDVHHDAGRLDPAEPFYLEALALYREHDAPPLDLANAIRSLAILREETGALDEAVTLWEEAHRLYIATNVPPGVEETATRLARIRGKE